MKDMDKTKEQLIDELLELRQRLNKLEASETDLKQPKDALQKAHDELERHVEEPTAELARINERLKLELNERKRAEEALRESEELFKAIFNNAGIGIGIADKNKNFSMVNNRMAQMLGTSKDELIGASNLDITYPEDIELSRKHLELLFQGEADSYRMEKRYIRKDGSVFWVDLSVSHILDKDGDTKASIGMFTDIADRKQAEEALRESERRFRRLVEHSKDAFFLHELDGRIIDVNNHACESLGYAREELIALSIRDIDQDFVFGNHFERWEKIVPGMPITLEGVHRRKDGTTFPVEIRLVCFESGEDQLMLGLVRDVTKRKLMEEALRERTVALERSNKELEQFAYVASHDLQEPLRMVASYTQLLAKRYKGRLDSDADEFINYAVDGATRMQVLINDLLDYSRVGTRGKDLEMTKCDAILKKTLDNLKKAVEESDAKVIRDPLPSVMADDVQIGQLFQNLINNAIKFSSDDPPQIHISAERNENKWIFSVRDNGIGIDPEYASRIFEIFQRLHGKEEYPGTGIGLAICKKIVERHGGNIWMESEPAKGSTFYFTILIKGEN